MLFEGVKVELGDGLVLRCATAADIDRVVAFNEMVHDVPDCGAGDAGTRALLDVLFPKRPSDTWLSV